MERLGCWMIQHLRQKEWGMAHFVPEDKQPAAIY
jgi:hypothetical protein